MIRSASSALDTIRSMFAGTNINAVSAGKLADATERCWAAIKDLDLKQWGKATTEAFKAQLEMFPAMMTPDVQSAVEQYGGMACGWKLTGCGGGGYLLLISGVSIPNAIKVVPNKS